MVAKATKIGSLYQLNHKPNHERTTFAEKCAHTGGYLAQALWASGNRHVNRWQMVSILKQPGSLRFVNPALKANSIVPRFLQAVEGQRSDLCGKMNEKSLGGAEYFLSFIVWVYFLKSKDQAFEKFLMEFHGRKIYREKTQGYSHR